MPYLKVHLQSSRERACKEQIKKWKFGDLKTKESGWFSEAGQQWSKSTDLKCM